MALEKELSPDIYRLLKFGRMESGTVRNAVSGKTVLLGSLRPSRTRSSSACQEGLRTIGRDIEKETGCTVDVHANDGYLPSGTPTSCLTGCETPGWTLRSWTSP